MFSAISPLLLGFAEAAESNPLTPYDCLAGVCLGDAEEAPTQKVVDVAGQKMSRSLTVCEERIVEIQVFQAWHTGPVENPWVKYDSGYFRDSEERTSLLLEELAKLGWNAPSAEDKTLDRGKNQKTEAKIWDLHNPGKQGQRVLLLSKVRSRVYDWETLAVKLALISRHPDKEALCAPKRQQGL